MDRKEIRDVLTASTCVVSFVKVNGERRDMECTLDPAYIPKVEVVETSSKKGKVPRQPDSVLPVWDVNKEAWRSFRIDSVFKITMRVPEAGEVVLFEKDD